ncbi:MAG: NHLP bacteriocin system secretion protein [Deltaproteobacteria bacterium]|jgi:HlyD family secretion protein
MSSPFREAALERLSSPEQLDSLMQVTTAKGWIALLTSGVLVAGLTVWSVVGRLPTNITGSGVLLYRGGVTEVTALGSGQVTALHVAENDVVKVGQTIAEVAQPDLVDQITDAEAAVEQARADLETLQRFGTEDQRLQAVSLRANERDKAAALTSARDKLAYLEERHAAQLKLHDRGLITGSTLQQTKQSIDGAQAEIAQLTQSVRELRLSTLRNEKQSESELRNAEVRLAEAERRVETLKERLATSSKVASPYAGRVVEVRARRGAQVNTGGPVIALELTSPDDVEELEAVVYLPLAEGKRVQPGMRVRVSPATVKEEEFGMIHGEVRAVDGFVSSRQGMARLLENEDLVSSLMQSAGGTALGVRVTLDRDEAAKSGFSWTSGEGPPLQVESGTPCSATITLETERPIAQLLPSVARWLGP